MFLCRCAQAQAVTAVAAPRGRTSRAARATPWVSESPPIFFASPEGAAQPPSIPHLPLVVGDPVGFPYRNPIALPMEDYALS